MSALLIWFKLVYGTFGQSAMYYVQLREYYKNVEFRLHHRLSKFDWSVFLNLKPISYFFVIFMAWFLSKIYWSWWDHDIMASIWEKATGDPHILWFHNSWSPLFRDSVSGLNFVNSSLFCDFKNKKCKKKFLINFQKNLQIFFQSFLHTYLSLIT